ncbi:MAG: NAD(P)H-dependent glycerol-3-phosphate dehydrogenase [Candidatus Omnitrophota bacterium]|nr:NAD(P)-dependent glycerol-3-phosphate dehydrogenase [Candidatus Omnitrophota bacterium]
MSKVCVIGDGGWGTALALLLYSKGTNPVLWSVSSDYAEYLNKTRENVKFLKGVSLPRDLRITSDDSIIKDSDYAFFVVPCEYLSSIAKRFCDGKFKHIISAVKGIENGSLKRPSEILSDCFPSNNISVLSGPSISYEVAKCIPTTVVVASNNNDGTKIQNLLISENFRVYTSKDLVGVELGGALKNIIAIAAGISDGLGFGTNSKAAILTRGLAEITRLGVKLGADRETFSGLSGIGDLATTCISGQSRNRWFGEQIGKGRTVQEIMSGTEVVVEGVATCKSARDLAAKHNIEMPITEKVYEVIYQGKSPALAVKELMTRSAKEEKEYIN